jgi:hypothetical protein
MVQSKRDLLVNVVLVKKDKCVVDSFSFTFLYSVLLLSFFIFSGVWIEVATMNINVWEMDVGTGADPGFNAYNNAPTKP